MKTIYIEPNEEIISVVDRLIQTGSEQVDLVVPSGAQIWQSSINLKLLKREIDNLNKQVALIVSDDLGAEMAERVGFVVKKEKDLPGESVQQEQEEEKEQEQEEAEDREDMIGLLVKKLESEKESVQPQAVLAKAGGKVEKDSSSSDSQPVPIHKKSPSLSGLRFKEPRKKMVDIVNPDKDVKVKFFRRQFLRKKSPERIEPAARPAKPVELEPIARQQAAPMVREVPASSRWPKFFIIFIVAAFLIAGLVGYLVLPTTEITLWPKTEKVNFDLSVLGSMGVSQIDENLNKIPLQAVEVKKTKSGEFLATGEKEINEKARGFITVYNEYSSSPQTLVATTRFESPEGKIFRIMESVTIPGAKVEQAQIIPSSIEVEVVADEAGEDYNIEPTDFTIPGFKGTPKFVGFYGQSKAPMSGGLTGKVKVASTEDVDKAEEGLIEELKNELRQALEEQIPDDLKIMEGGLKEEITTISTIEPGTKTDKFTIEMKALTQVLLYKEEDLKNLVDLNLISQVSDNKVPLSETQQISWDEPVIDWVKGEALLSLKVEEEVAWQIDIQSLKQELVGQSEVEVRKYLANQEEIEKAKVSFWPFWVKKIPSQEKKIEIIIETGE